jgi:hypothetical protein
MPTTQMEEVKVPISVRRSGSHSDIYPTGTYIRVSEDGTLSVFEFVNDDAGPVAIYAAGSWFFASKAPATPEGS